MQAIMETSFNVIYLLSITIIGIIIFRASSKGSEHRYFAIMALLLATGDAFHLVPRSYALFTTGLEANAAALGIGKLITSVTMTIFYLLLYVFWKKHYRVNNTKILDISIGLLAISRIALCLFPQNDWLNYQQPVTWGIYRNIPFAVMGLIILLLFYKEGKKANDPHYRLMWLAITLSFLFYIPVVLWAKTYSWIGALMIPKTLAYVWIVIMGYRHFKNSNK